MHAPALIYHGLMTSTTGEILTSNMGTAAYPTGNGRRNTDRHISREVREHEPLLFTGEVQMLPFSAIHQTPRRAGVAL